MVLYDDFSSSIINPIKWAGVAGDPYILDEVRNLAAVPGVPKAKQPHLMQRAYGGTTDNSGGTGGLFGLSFPNPGTITAVSFTVVVNTLTEVDCKANPGTVTEAEFRGNFFNTDVPATTTDHDVSAEIGIAPNTGHGNLTVGGFIQEGDGTILGYQVFGAITLKSVNTLFIQWDQHHHQFIFQLNNDAQVFESYSVSDTSLPVSAYKGIDISRVVSDCTSAPRPNTVSDADFRDVYVNQ
jgi:hypothetical protein